MTKCPECDASIPLESQHCVECGAKFEDDVSQAPARLTLVEWGMLLLSAALVAFVLRAFTAPDLTLTLWFIEVSASKLAWLFYVGGLAGALMVAIGYAQRRPMG